MSHEMPPDPFLGINRRKDKRGRDLEPFVIEAFAKINKDDEIAYNIVDPVTGERSNLEYGTVVSKYPAMLEVEVKPKDSSQTIPVYIEEIH